MNSNRISSIGRRGRWSWGRLVELITGWAVVSVARNRLQFSHWNQFDQCLMLPLVNSLWIITMKTERPQPIRPSFMWFLCTQVADKKAVGTYTKEETIWLIHILCIAASYLIIFCFQKGWIIYTPTVTTQDTLVVHKIIVILEECGTEIYKCISQAWNE